MPEFAYKALDSTGRAVAGVVSAADRAAAVLQLGQGGTFVTDLEPASGEKAGEPRRMSRGISARQRLGLLRQLSVGLSAGLNLVSSLQVVAEQAGSAAVRDLVNDLIERVTAGDALSEAMRRHPRVFPLMQVSMTRAGETAGALDRVMTSLASFAEADLELREKLRSAAIYPLMVVALGVVSILVIMLFILPRIMAVVSEAGGTLPLPTRLLMGATELLRSPGGALVGLVALAGGVWFWRWRQTPEGRLRCDAIKLRLPVVGPAIRRVAVSRLARTLGTLASAGIPIVESMKIVRDTLGNEALARHIDSATDGIVRGSAIADELRKSGQFPQLLVQVIAMGERTGRLDELLMSTAQSYDKETAVALQRVMSIVPVLLILVLAAFVAFILAAALLPIMNLDLSTPGG